MDRNPLNSSPLSPDTCRHSPFNPFTHDLIILTDIYPLNSFTPGPKHSQTPIFTPLHPWPRQTPTPTHFTHDPQYLHTPIPLTLSPMGPNTLIHPSQTPFHPWPRHRHPPLKPSTCFHQYLQTTRNG